MRQSFDRMNFPFGCSTTLRSRVTVLYGDRLWSEVGVRSALGWGAHASGWLLPSCSALVSVAVSGTAWRQEEKVHTIGLNCQNCH